MKNKIVLVKIDYDYCNYLRKFDSRVPYNYGIKEIRPFVGVLFKIKDIMYYAPLSSPKPKHLKMKNKLDFLKIDAGKLGAVNFNNMIPVTTRNINIIDLNRDYTNKSDKKYNSLLKDQLYWLNRNSSKIFNNSFKLYNKYNDGLLDKVTFDRCCNFPLLEKKCNLYNKLG